MSRKKDIERLKDSFGKLKEDSFDFEQIEKYFKNKDHSGSFQVLTNKTCEDLNFRELFMFLDRTYSRPGQQFLYNKLRTIPAGSQEVDFDERLIQRFSDDENFRMFTQTKLDKLNKLNKEDSYYISTLFQEEHVQPPKWFFVVRMLSFASLLSIISVIINPKMIFVLIGVFIVNLGIHYWNKKNLFQYLGSIPQLLRLKGIAQKLHTDPLLKEIAPNLNDSIKIIGQVRNRMSFFQMEAKLQGDLEALFWAMLEIVKIAFLLEPLLLFSVLKRLDKKRKEIEDVFCFVGCIDALMSIASLRKGLSVYCTPTISMDKISILAKHIYHPLITNCEPNSIDIVDKSILLTGSNMSGKTSFIRTIGINLITGLTINTCFAESMSISRLRIYSAIRISDDLLNDKSYYFEEVLTIKDMIEKCQNGKPNLFLLDEIFKGTNTIERISAGKAVLSALAKNNNIVFVSTHDIELTDMLSGEYELFHFSEIVTDNSVGFDYKLKEGKLKNRNAIRILQINDYPDEVIDEAIEISKKMDSIKLI